MPTYKTEILGSEIKINYQDAEKEKLIKLINSFKQRLNEFPQDNKINDKIIIYLSALKAEDELEDCKKIINENNIEKNEVFTKTKIILKLQNEIDNLKTENIDLKSYNLSVFNRINDLENLIDSINSKIKNKFNL